MSGNDILLIDKPVGVTSFDAIRWLRRKLGVKKIGHAGTLDPLASGLLIVGVGEGTKKLSEYIKLPKTYEVEILLGERRTTGDMEGEVVEEALVPSFSKEKIENVLKGMKGVLNLPVPVYSAVKQRGEPLYRKVRRGEKVNPPLRKMKLNLVRLTELNCDGSICILRVVMVVSSGTYIRSLAEEVGRRLGYPATVRSLRRTKIGEFDVKNAQKI